MGAGKSAVGAAVAGVLHRVFLDTDRIVEERAGTSISTLFEERGEPAFRELEAEAVKSATATDGAVIACGGGVVTHPANVEVLRASGTIIYLKVSPEVAARRIGPAGRPLLNGGNVESRLRDLIEERSAAYDAAADDEVNADLELNQVVTRVLQIAGDLR